MSGALVGLLAGVGVLLVLLARRPPGAPAAAPTPRVTRVELRRRMLAEAGLRGVSPARLRGLQALAATAAFLVVLLVSGTVTIAGCFAAFGYATPSVMVRRLRDRRRADLRELWPDVVDNLASAVRAGMPLPEALGQLGTRGPEPLRPPFTRFAADYRTSGRFAECLDRLKDALADPVGDRICEALRMAREVGGSDLGRLLRTLSAFLREDVRTRAELETRQGWTVNAARLAVAAPWLVLLLLATQRQTLAAYDTPRGSLVLLVGGGTCVLAYRVMLRIGRLPEERRVLR
ncbi:MAG: type II secretion system F family protein [Mycobacteriales bacterium]